MHGWELQARSPAPMTWWDPPPHLAPSPQLSGASGALPCSGKQWCKTGALSALHPGTLGSTRKAFWEPAPLPSPDDPAGATQAQTHTDKDDGPRAHAGGLGAPAPAWPGRGGASPPSHVSSECLQGSGQFLRISGSRGTSSKIPSVTDAHALNNGSPRVKERRRFHRHTYQL